MEVTNPESVALVNIPILADISIPYGHAVDGSREIRVIDSQGREIPSLMVYQSKEDAFTTRSYLLFFGNFTPNSRANYMIYYGNPIAPIPLYRIGDNPQRASNDFFTIESLDLQQTAMTAVIRLFYRGEEYFTLLPKIQFRAGPSYREWGPSVLAENLLVPSSEWTRYSRLGASQTTSMIATYKAGELRIVSVIVLEGSRVWFFKINANDGSSTLSGLSEFTLFDASTVSQRTLVAGSFRLSDNIFQITTSGIILGIKAQALPDKFDVALPEVAYDQTRQSRLGNQDQQTGRVAIVLEQRHNLLEKGATSVSSQLVTVASSTDQLVERLSILDKSPQVTISAEEYLSTPIPSSTLMVTEVQQFTNTTIPRSGVRLTTAATASGWLASSVSLEGETTYSVPGPGDADFEDSRIWRTATVAEAQNSTAFATSRTWSEDKQSYVGHIRVLDNDRTVTAQANLTSSYIRVVGASTTSLKLDYKASIANAEGFLPRLLLALELDSNFDERPDEVLTFPVKESFEKLGEVGIAVLENDGLWHTDTRFDLTNYIAGDFQFRLAAIADTFGNDGSAEAYRGTMELFLDNVSIQVAGDNKNVFMVRFNPQTQNGTFVYRLPGLNTDPGFSLSNVTVSFTLLRPLQANLAENGVVEIVVAESLPNVREPRVIMHSVPQSLVNGVSLGLTLLTTQLYDLSEPVVIVKGEAFFDVYRTEKLVPFTLSLSLSYHMLTVRVTDTNQEVLANATLNVLDSYGHLMASKTTDAQGLAVFALPPSQYAVEASYHGERMENTNLQLANDSILDINAKVISTGFRVTDFIGGAVQNAQVTIKSEAVTLATAVTGNDGRTFFQLVPQRLYTVEVSIDGQPQLSQEITPVVNGAIITLGTSYIPFFVLLVLGIVIIAVVLGVVVWARTYFRVKKRAS